MEAKRLDAEKFLTGRENIPVLDVRTPIEYKRGHIPGAFLFPLFSNEERAEIGKLYAINGSEKAIEKGYEIAGPKLKEYLNEVIRIAPERELFMYCWRGGMRSASLAWLLEFSGFRVSILNGGYKAYRSYCRERMGKPASIVLLGGYTGSGKSEILNIIESKGEQVLKLEKLARHKGSAFGWIGESDQPGQEEFENSLSDCWLKFDSNKTVWIEDESINIGRLQVPRELFIQMEQSAVIFFETDKKIRVERLVQDYRSASGEELKLVFNRISKRIGTEDCRLAIDAIDRGDLHSAALIALSYYDKAYGKKLDERNPKSLYKVGYIENSEGMVEELIRCRNKIRNSYNG